MMMMTSHFHFSRGMAGMFMPVALQSNLSSADKVFFFNEDLIGMNTTT